MEVAWKLHGSCMEVAWKLRAYKLAFQINNLMNFKPKKTSGNIEKICSVCGKAETYHWVHHWKVWHKVFD